MQTATHQLAKLDQAGFTLIEIMIVLAILSILVTVAFPTYESSIRKSARTAAKGALMDVAARQEQFFMNNKSYSSSLTGLGLPDPYYIDKKNDGVTSTDANRAYQLSLENVTGTSFDAKATPQLSQTADVCGSYTLKADGSKVVTGAPGTSVCW